MLGYFKPLMQDAIKTNWATIIDQSVERQETICTNLITTKLHVACMVTYYKLITSS